MGLRDLLTAPPVTPPAVVRLGLLTAYCYAWQVGLRTQAACVAAAWGAWFGGAATGGDGLLLPASVAYDAQHGICLLTAIYALDAALAACPLHWCCMRSIPPKNVRRRRTDDRKPPPREDVHAHRLLYHRFSFN